MLEHRSRSIRLQTCNLVSTISFPSPINLHKISSGSSGFLFVHVFPRKSRNFTSKVCRLWRYEHTLLIFWRAFNVFEKLRCFHVRAERANNRILSDAFAIPFTLTHMVIVKQNCWDLKKNIGVGKYQEFVSRISSGDFCFAKKLIEGLETNKRFLMSKWPGKAFIHWVRWDPSVDRTIFSRRKLDNERLFFVCCYAQAYAWYTIFFAFALYEITWCAVSCVPSKQHDNNFLEPEQKDFILFFCCPLCF